MGKHSFNGGWANGNTKNTAVSARRRSPTDAQLQAPAPLHLVIFPLFPPSHASTLNLPAPVSFPIQVSLDLDLAAATDKDGKLLFPNLAASRCKLKLWPGSLSVTLDGALDSAPTTTTGLASDKHSPQIAHDKTAGAFSREQAIELSSARFEQYCGEIIQRQLLTQEPVAVSTTELRKHGLKEAAAFLERNKLRLQARRTRGNPVAEVLRDSKQPWQGRLPVDVLAELRRDRFCDLATELLDRASLPSLGFCSLDTRDPRFLINSVAPSPSDAVTSASDEIPRSHRSILRLVRVAHGSAVWRKMQHHGTRVTTANAMCRAIQRFARGRVWLRYIADYEPSRRNCTSEPAKHMCNEVLLKVCPELFAVQGPAEDDIVIPKGKDAFVVLIDNHEQRPEVLDMAEQVVAMCLSPSLPEDVDANAEPIRYWINSHDELPKVVADLVANQHKPDTIVISTTAAASEPSGPLTPPDVVLPSHVALVDVREVSHLNRNLGALLWLLRQPDLAVVAARVGVKDVMRLVEMGAQPAELARLAWLSPPKQRAWSRLPDQLRDAFDEGGSSCLWLQEGGWEEEEGEEEE